MLAMGNINLDRNFILKRSFVYFELVNSQVFNVISGKLSFIERKGSRINRFEKLVFEMVKVCLLPSLLNNSILTNSPETLPSEIRAF
jgi:hypothetical protein